MLPAVLGARMDMTPATVAAVLATQPRALDVDQATFIDPRAAGGVWLVDDAGRAALARRRAAQGEPGALAQAIEAGRADHVEPEVVTAPRGLPGQLQGDGSGPQRATGRDVLEDRAALCEPEVPITCCLPV